eukprot:COSAG01_NODE_8553_length_2744_cov_4.364461_3_plen_102_part_00
MGSSGVVRSGGGVGAEALTGASVLPPVSNCGIAGFGCGGGGGGGDDDDGALSTSSASSVKTIKMIAQGDTIVTAPPVNGDTRRAICARTLARGPPRVCPGC